MVKRREREILQTMIDAGIVDIDHPEYGTTALTILSEIAAKAERPDSPISLAVPQFLRAWQSMRQGGSGRAKMNLPDDTFIHMEKYNHFMIMRPNAATVSYRLDAGTGRLTRLRSRRPDANDKVDARVRMIEAYIHDRVKKLDGLIEADGVRHLTDFGSYHPYRFEVRMKTGYRCEVSVSVAAMRNDSDADLLRPIDHEMNALVAQQLNFRYDDPVVKLEQQWIDNEVRKSGLPVTIRIVPGKSSNTPIPIILTGYGINGMTSRIEIATMYRDNKDVENLHGKLLIALETQRIRHEMHGPAPRDTLGNDWKVDAILDRHLARIDGGRAILRRMMEEGRLRDGNLPGVVLRVVGKVVYGTVRLGPKVISHGDRVRFDDAVLAATVQNALKGQPLSQLAEHPDFPEDMLISRCRTFYRKHRDYTVAHTKKHLVPLPARERREHQGPTKTCSEP